MTTQRTAEIGIFGGSGFYEFLESATEISIDTPYGAPSSPISLGHIGDRAVAFIARHGREHQFSPAQVPARANLWAMQALGVQRILGPCAAGSLSPDVHPGDFVVLDQLVDRTTGRADTYYDQGTVHHVSFADPYCDELRPLAMQAGIAADIAMHNGGTVVVIPGPRFATRAESGSYRAQGWQAINMTQYPESYLARELGMCYCGVALITDYDTGVEHDVDLPPVTEAQVFAFFQSNVHRVREFLTHLIPLIPTTPACSCADARGPLPHS